MLGLMYTSAKLNKLMYQGDGQQELRFYQCLADEFRTDICLFSVKNLPASRSEPVQGYVYAHQDGRWAEKKGSLPRVNLYQPSSYLRKNKTIRTLNGLEQQGILFLNAVTNQERDKYGIYQYLIKEDVSSWLPESASLTVENLLRFLEQYEQVFIKPRNGSKGNNIYKLEKQQEQILMTHVQPSLINRKFISYAELHPLEKHFSKPADYCLQQGLRLKEQAGLCFDIRVTVQKDRQKEWQVTDMFARTASQGAVVTNLEKGGRAMPVRDVMGEETIQQVLHAGTHIAKTIGRYVPRVCDMALDMVVDDEDQVWFLEANFRPIRHKLGKRERITFEYACAQVVENEPRETEEQYNQEAEQIAAAHHPVIWNNDHDWEDKEPSQQCVTDEICGHIEGSSATKIVLWENFLPAPPFGSVSFYCGDRCEVMDVFINEELAFTLTKGQTRSVTFPFLQKLEVECRNVTHIGIGRYCLTIHYPCP